MGAADTPALAAQWTVDIERREPQPEPSSRNPPSTPTPERAAPHDDPRRLETPARAGPIPTDRDLDADTTRTLASRSLRGADAETRADVREVRRLPRARALHRSHIVTSKVASRGPVGLREQIIRYKTIAYKYSPKGIGGAEEIRTPDLCIANAALSQLSYGPTRWNRRNYRVLWATEPSGSYRGDEVGALSRRIREAPDSEIPACQRQAVRFSPSP